MASIITFRPTGAVRQWAHAGLLMALASCGGDGAGSGATADNAGGTSPVVTVPAASPSPTPTPAPSPTPTPSPSPTPTPLPTPDLYVIGRLTWSFQGDIPDHVRGPITDSMNWAINQTNTLADYQGNVTVVYGAGTPTADAGFNYRIRFGGYITWNSALHELAHWLGSGTFHPWKRMVVNGRFTGPITDTRIKAYDGPGAMMNADWAHFWPYGYNGNDPFHEWQRNVMLVSAQRADMGLSDGAYYITGDRRFINRSSRLMLDGDGSTSTAAAIGEAPSLTWKVTYVDGYVVLTNAASGRVLDSLGTATDGGPTALAAPSAGPRQQWEMIPTDDGWFLLRNRETRKCLDNVGDLAAGTAMRVWGCGRHPNQQWHLMR